MQIAKAAAAGTIRRSEPRAPFGNHGLLVDMFPLKPILHLIAPGRRTVVPNSGSPCIRRVPRDRPTLEWFFHFCEGLAKEFGTQLRINVHVLQPPVFVLELLDARDCRHARDH
jgi:hypothetical protein